MYKIVYSKYNLLIYENDEYYFEDIFKVVRRQCGFSLRRVLLQETIWTNLEKLFKPVLASQHSLLASYFKL